MVECWLLILTVLLTILSLAIASLQVRVERLEEECLEFIRSIGKVRVEAIRSKGKVDLDAMKLKSEVNSLRMRLGLSPLPLQGDKEVENEV